MAYKGTLSSALDALPEKLPDLVEYLVAQGLGGVPRNRAADCPISRYLTDFTNYERPFEIVKRVKEVGPGWRYMIYGHPNIELPDAVHEFIPLYDAGEYPELVDSYTYRWI